MPHDSGDCRPGVRGVVLLLCAGGVLFAGCSGGLGHRSIADLTGRLPLPPGVHRVRLEAQAGIFEIVAGSDPAVVYSGELRRAADTAEDLQGLESVPTALVAAPDPKDAGTLVVRTPAMPPQVRMQHCVLATEVKVWLPAALEVEVLVTGGGQVTVADRTGDVQLRSGHGDLQLTGCSGAAKLHSGGGSVLVYRHHGDLEVDTMVGDVQVWMQAAGRKLILVTGSGNIQCRIPWACGFQLDARTMEGRVVAKDFGLEARAQGAHGAVMRGTHGDGMTELVLHTGAGYVSVSPHVE